MANFSKLDGADTVIELRDGSSVVGRKVLNTVYSEEHDETTIQSFMNDGFTYKQYDTESPAFINGYYIPSLNKNTNQNIFIDSWKLDGTDLIFGPPEPWPLIDYALTNNGEYVVIWEENPNRMIRKKINSDGSFVTPEVVQVYNTTNQTWEAE